MDVGGGDCEEGKKEQRLKREITRRIEIEKGNLGKVRSGNDGGGTDREDDENMDIGNDRTTKGMKKKEK